jgi:hypothetical protein
MHHATAVATPSFQPSATCPDGHMVAIVQITVTTPGGYVWYQSDGSSIGMYGPAAS